MARIRDKCKKEESRITKDTNSSLWLCEGCLKKARKKKKKNTSLNA